jgi:hypothetical protein
VYRLHNRIPHFNNVYKLQRNRNAGLSGAGFSLRNLVLASSIRIV